LFTGKNRSSGNVQRNPILATPLHLNLNELARATTVRKLQQRWRLTGD